MATIISKKELEKLFSWSQFYENSESLAVPRFPRHYTWENGRKSALISETDRLNHQKCQQQIINLGNRK